MREPAAEGSYLFPVVPGEISTAERDEATVTAATKPVGDWTTRFVPLALETWPIHSCCIPEETE